MGVPLKTTFRLFHLKKSGTLINKYSQIDWLAWSWTACQEGVVQSPEMILAMPSAKFYSNKDEFFQ